MFNNLYLYGIGDFSDNFDSQTGYEDVYYSSTEADNGNVWGFNFGEQGDPTLGNSWVGNKIQSIFVRAVRAF